MKTYHMKYLIIFWTFASFLIINHFVNDIKALLVSEKEFRIESFEQHIERKDFKILIEKKIQTRIKLWKK